MAAKGSCIDFMFLAPLLPTRLLDPLLGFLEIPLLQGVHGILEIHSRQFQAKICLNVLLLVLVYFPVDESVKSFDPFVPSFFSICYVCYCRIVSYHQVKCSLKNSNIITSTSFYHIRAFLFSLLFI